MKNWVLMIFITVSLHGYSQGYEVEQLLLNVEKLIQFKQILQDMKKGYEVLHNGYSSIRDISQGNFSLHKAFLDGLLEVSPVVRKYKRVADIIRYQSMIVKNYKNAMNAGTQFKVAEMDYIKKVCNHLFQESLKNLDELSLVITSGKLRMSDEERLQSIDRVYGRVVDQFSFLKAFTDEVAVLELQRRNESGEIEMSRRLTSPK